MVSRLPVKSALRKSAKAAAWLGAAALAGKLGESVFKKVSKKVDASIAESKNDALSEIKITVNRELEKFILECVIRWVLYISLIITAYIAAKAFNLRKDVLVSFVILGIYSFYLIKFSMICRWYLSFCRSNGFMIRPSKIIRAYLFNAVLEGVQRKKDGLPLHERLAMNFFGPGSDKIAGDITAKSLQSAEIKKEALARLGMWACGWIVYALVYEKLFLLAAGIDFKALWEPLIWPFHTLIKILAA